MYMHISFEIFKRRFVNYTFIIRQKYLMTVYTILWSRCRINSNSAYVVSSVKFLVKSCDEQCQTQNYGVSAWTHAGIDNDYYRYLEEIVELVYIKDYRVVWVSLH